MCILINSPFLLHVTMNSFIFPVKFIRFTMHEFTPCFSVSPFNLININYADR